MHPNFFPSHGKMFAHSLGWEGGGGKNCSEGGGAKPLKKITIQIYLRAIFANNFGVIDSAAPSEQN